MKKESPNQAQHRDSIINLTQMPAEASNSRMGNPKSMKVEYDKSFLRQAVDHLGNKLNK